MGYDADFYDTYEGYLLEERVRSKHDKIIGMWATRSEFLSVIDLGCGHFKEFLEFGPRSLVWYRGYDVNAPASATSEKADYRSPDFIERVHALDEKPTAFVSLFSAECTATPIENMELYERLFREIPTLRRGLVSGFYYASRRDENPIEEVGGIVSWQTLDRVEHAVSDVFDEFRVTARVPSTLFGEDVVEVWRMFERRL